MKSYKIGLLVSTIALLPSLTFASTLENVIKKDVITCGIAPGNPGFSSIDSKGTWTGLDVDFCRSVAAAVLSDASKVKYIPLSSPERFTALQTGEVDLLARTTTWTSSRDTSLGLNFTGVNFYDGQGFLVKKSLGITSAKELNGATFCIQGGTTTELNLTDYFVSNNMEYKQITYDTATQAKNAFLSGRCDALTTDASALYGIKTQLADPSYAIVLPEIISKEPLGPLVRQGDDQWFNIVRWTLFASLQAEELNVNASNLSKMIKSQSPTIKRLLGTSGNTGKDLGITNDWAYQIVKQVGNYGEVFDRNVGKDSPLKIARGLNALWSNGGLMYPMPIR